MTDELARPTRYERGSIRAEYASTLGLWRVGHARDLDSTDTRSVIWIKDEDLVKDAVVRLGAQDEIVKEALRNASTAQQEYKQLLRQLEMENNHRGTRDSAGADEDAELADDSGAATDPG